MSAESSLATGHFKSAETKLFSSQTEKDRESKSSPFTEPPSLALSQQQDLGKRE